MGGQRGRHKDVKGHVANVWVPELHRIVRARDMRHFEHESTIIDAVLDGSGRVIRRKKTNSIDPERTLLLSSNIMG